MDIIFSIPQANELLMFLSTLLRKKHKC